MLELDPLEKLFKEPYGTICKETHRSHYLSQKHVLSMICYIVFFEKVVLRASKRVNSWLVQCHSVKFLVRENVVLNNSSPCNSASFTPDSQSSPKKEAPGRIIVHEIPIWSTAFGIGFSRISSLDSFGVSLVSFKSKKRIFCLSTSSLEHHV